jgi:hypothetical protein
MFSIHPSNPYNIRKIYAMSFFFNVHSSILYSIRKTYTMYNIRIIYVLYE